MIMVAGNQPRLVGNLFKGIRTLTGNIVMEMGYATGLHREALIATGVVLFVFILIINFSVALLKSYADVREAVAQSLNERFGTEFEGKNIVMTVGAAGGLNVILKSLLNPADEVIVFAPYFGEYRSYVSNYDGVLVEVSPDTETFQPKLAEFEEKITAKTKAVIVNTPNNPTGVVYSEETIEKMAEILEKKQKEFGTDIYLISDEPYRELAYDGQEIEFVISEFNPRRNRVIGDRRQLLVAERAEKQKELFARLQVGDRVDGVIKNVTDFGAFVDLGGVD